MARNRKLPAFFGRNPARATQARYLKQKKPEGKRIQEHRQAAGNVICLCWMVALNDRYGIGAKRLQKVTDAANAELAKFTLHSQAVGMECAKRKLTQEVARLVDGEFILPTVKIPKKSRDWELLAEQRDAAQIVVKCYALATHKALGFGKERLEQTIQATENVFREFVERAETGDYYGYVGLAKRLETILHETITVDDSQAEEPIFGETVT